MNIFETAEFQKVRTKEIDGKTYYLTADVFKALDYSGYPSGYLSMKRAIVPCELVKIDGKLYLTKTGIYQFLMQCKLPIAMEFKRWVVSEVIPALIQNEKGETHGKY